MIEKDRAAKLLEKLDQALEAGMEPGERAALCVRLLAAEFPHFDWVGVYWLQGEELVLGPFVGAPTEHVRIPVGRGVCGTAVAEGRNQVVKDVRELSNYLACSLETRSEIVVLIRDGEGKILGQIDVDGRRVGAFDETDEALLEKAARRIAGRMEKKEE